MSELRSYICARTESPIEIDGNLDKPQWSKAVWSEDFVDILGDAFPAPRHRTRVKMLWDDVSLYIAAELEEPHLWATLTETDSVIFQDNDFELFLDPDADNHYYAELEINALGTTWDLLLPKPYKDGGHPLTGWRIKGLRSAVMLQGTVNNPGDIDRGWSIELALPWDGLREISRVDCPPKDGDQWRINFSRVQWDLEVDDCEYRKIEGRSEHNWVWSPQGVIDMHRPESWGLLHFSEARPDPSLPVRAVLHETYYKQRTYREANGRYAQSTKELGMPEVVEIEATAHLFEAHSTVKYQDGSVHTWRIDSDSLIREL